MIVFLLDVVCFSQINEVAQMLHQLEQESRKREEDVNWASFSFVLFHAIKLHDAMSGLAGSAPNSGMGVFLAVCVAPAYEFPFAARGRAAPPTAPVGVFRFQFFCFVLQVGQEVS